MPIPASRPPLFLSLSFLLSLPPCEGRWCIVGGIGNRKRGCVGGSGMVFADVDNYPLRSKPLRKSWLYFNLFHNYTWMYLMIDNVSLSSLCYVSCLYSFLIWFSLFFLLFVSVAVCIDDNCNLFNFAEFTSKVYPCWPSCGPEHTPEALHSINNNNIHFIFIVCDFYNCTHWSVIK